MNNSACNSTMSNKQPYVNPSFEHKRRVENIKHLCGNGKRIHVLGIPSDMTDLSWLEDRKPVFLKDIVENRELFHYDTRDKVIVCYYQNANNRPVLYFASDLKEQVPASLYFMTTTLSYTDGELCYIWADKSNPSGATLTQERYLRRLKM